MRQLMTIAAILAIGAVGYLGLVFFLQRTVLFPRPPLPPASVAADRPDVEVVWLGSELAVEAWYLLPHDAAGPAPALIFMHGNGELIDYWPDQFDAARRWGMGVLLLEYPGYGRSGGRPTEESITEAATAAYDYLAGRPDVDPGRVIAYGRSLGGGAAGALTRHRQPAAVILESAFTSVRDLARRYGLVGPLVLDPFDNLSALREFEGPVLIIHGERDRMIPAAHGRKLAETSRRGEYVGLDCGHNDCPQPWEIIHGFLRSQGLLEPSRAATF